MLAALLSADLLDKLARIPAGRARKTLGLDSDFAFGADNNLDGLPAAPLAAWITRLMESSGGVCSGRLRSAYQARNPMAFTSQLDYYFDFEIIGTL